MPTSLVQEIPVLQKAPYSLELTNNLMPYIAVKPFGKFAKKIIQRGSPILNKHSLPLLNSEADILPGLLQDLGSTLKDVMNGHDFRTSAGISAVQIGKLKRVCLIWTPPMGFKFMINPVIEFQSARQTLEFEGCLSFFDKRGRVPRAESIIVSFLDHNLKPHEDRFVGAAARITLHEIDHMDGILYTDRMRKSDHLLGMKEYMALRKS